MTLRFPAVLSNHLSLFLETKLDFGSGSLSSVGQQAETNQHFPITRQVHTLSHSTSPSTVGAHIWSDVIRKTVPQTEQSSYAIFITLLPYHMTLWINCMLFSYSRRNRVGRGTEMWCGTSESDTSVALCLHVLMSDQEK